MENLDWILGKAWSEVTTTQPKRQHPSSAIAPRFGLNFLQFRRRMIPKKSKSIFGTDDAQIKVLQRPLRVRRRAAL
ncbi:MAG: hypothetical protein E5Y32_27330 [Mesorhizobium sp.]|nr:MAG: hypothetical protein E5Y32_27330 [Mesorhizobium sp.]